MALERADLDCASCGRRTEHELSYAGRLLEHTRCSECGHEVEHHAHLPHDYVQDLRQRVLSKPSRLIRHALDDPIGFATHLPQQIAKQPVKFVREFWTVFRAR